MRHALPLERSSRARTIVGCLALWSLIATLLSAAPRYEKAVQLLFVLSVLALSVLARPQWPAVGNVAAGAATFLLATAGVVAAVSMDAAFNVLAGALLLGLVAGVTRLLGSVAGRSCRT